MLYPALLTIRFYSILVRLKVRNLNSIIRKILSFYSILVRLKVNIQF